MCSFRVGDKVVCVNARRYEHILTEGAVYTVSAVEPDMGDIYLGLVETPNGTGLQWVYRRFRPATKGSTDKGMSILRGLLDKADKPVKVTA